MTTTETAPAARRHDPQGVCLELDCVAPLLRGLPHDRREAVDAGAHRGQYSRAAGELGLRVLAIEANPAIADDFAANAAAGMSGGTVRLARCAVSDRDGVADFFVGSASTVSTLEPDWTTHGFPEEFARPRTLRVPVRRLDGLCLEHGFTAPGLLKVDVEGHELPALRGFFDRGLLPPPAVVMFEAFSRFPAAAEACIDYLLDQGYTTLDLVVRVGAGAVDLERFCTRGLPRAWRERPEPLFYVNVLAYHPSVLPPRSLPSPDEMRNRLNLPDRFVR